MTAGRRNDAAVLFWLAKASDRGSEIRYETSGAHAFDAYVRDPRVLLIEANARALRPAKMLAEAQLPPLAAEPAQE